MFHEGLSKFVSTRRDSSSDAETESISYAPKILLSARVGFELVKFYAVNLRGLDS